MQGLDVALHGFLRFAQSLGWTPRVGRWPEMTRDDRHEAQTSWPGPSEWRPELNVKLLKPLECRPLPAPSSTPIPSRSCRHIGFDGAWASTSVPWAVSWCCCWASAICILGRSPRSACENRKAMCDMGWQWMTTDDMGHCVCVCVLYMRCWWCVTEIRSKHSGFSVLTCCSHVSHVLLKDHTPIPPITKPVSSCSVKAQFPGYESVSGFQVGIAQPSASQQIQQLFSSSPMDAEKKDSTPGMVSGWRKM